MDGDVVIDFSVYNPLMNSAMHAIRFQINQRTFLFRGDFIGPDTYTGIVTNKSTEELVVLMEVLSNIFTIILDYGKDWMTKI